MTNHKLLHENLKKEVQIEISRTFQNIVAIPYDVGVARAFDNPRRVYKYGQDGVPDLMFIGPGGQVRFGDVKTGKSGLSSSQKAFRAVCIAVCGKDIVFVIKSVDDTINYILKEYPGAIEWGENTGN